jgi:hypothetical protein
MKTPQRFQKTCTVISLVTLALGFSAIGLVTLLNLSLSGDWHTLSAIVCATGGLASMATAGVFLFAALVYWRRYAQECAASNWRVVLLNTSFASSNAMVHPVTALLW